MKHQTLDQLHAVAEINTTQPVMSRTQRLVRWAELLGREPSRLLNALVGTEYPCVARARCDARRWLADSGCLHGPHFARRGSERRQLWRSQALLRADRPPTARDCLLLPCRRGYAIVQGSALGSCGDRPTHVRQVITWRRDDLGRGPTRSCNDLRSRPNEELGCNACQRLPAQRASNRATTAGPQAFDYQSL